MLSFGKDMAEMLQPLAHGIDGIWHWLPDGAESAEPAEEHQIHEAASAASAQCSQDSS